MRAAIPIVILAMDLFVLISWIITRHDPTSNTVGRRWSFMAAMMSGSLMVVVLIFGPR